MEDKLIDLIVKAKCGNNEIMKNASEELNFVETKQKDDVLRAVVNMMAQFKILGEHSKQILIYAKNFFMKLNLNDMRKRSTEDNIYMINNMCAAMKSMIEGNFEVENKSNIVIEELSFTKNSDRNNDLIREMLIKFYGIHKLLDRSEKSHFLTLTHEIVLKKLKELLEGGYQSTFTDYKLLCVIISLNFYQDYEDLTKKTVINSNYEIIIDLITLYENLKPNCPVLFSKQLKACIYDCFVALSEINVDYFLKKINSESTCSNEKIKESFLSEYRYLNLLLWFCNFDLLEQREARIANLKMRDHETSLELLGMLESNPLVLFEKSNSTANEIDFDKYQIKQFSELYCAIFRIIDIYAENTVAYNSRKSHRQSRRNPKSYNCLDYDKYLESRYEGSIDPDDPYDINDFKYHVPVRKESDEEFLDAKTTNKKENFSSLDLESSSISYQLESVKDPHLKAILGVYYNLEIKLTISQFNNLFKIYSVQPIQESSSNTEQENFLIEYTIVVLKLAYSIVNTEIGKNIFESSIKE